MTLGDRARERRGDASKIHHLFETTHVGHLRADIGGLQFYVALFLSHFLLAYGFRFDEILPTNRRGLGEIQCRFRPHQFSAGLKKLLAHFRRIDLSENLTFFDNRADVHQPTLHIAIRSGIDRRVIESP